MLLFKVLCTPVLIYLSVLAARRWGAFVGGCIAGLPTISGPASLFLALEQGPHWARAAALDALYAVGAVALFALAYAWSARKFCWQLSIALSVGVFFVAGWCVQFLPRNPALGIASGLLWPYVAVWLLPKASDNQQESGSRARWILPVQCLSGAALVVGISEGARLLGTHWSGVLCFFPVMIALLSPWVHASFGPEAASRLEAGLMTGFMGGTSFTAVILLFVESMSIAQCYLLASAVAIGLSGLVTAFLLWRRGLLGQKRTS